MKAILLKQIGKIEDLKKNLVIEELSLPKTNDDEVLIKIKYSSLNHRDLWITKGLYAGIKLPVVLGSDCSGTIVDKGKSVTNFSVGEEVVVNPGMNWGESEFYQGNNFKILGLPDNGTLEEYIAVDKSFVYKKPGHLTSAEAASFPLAGLTAYRAVFIKGDIKKNQNVLITGIGGGVSTFSLLYAVKKGARVYVTSGSEEKIKKAIELGAENGVNYRNEDWGRKILELCKSGFDLIIDGTGGDNILKCLDVINPGGRIVNYGATSGKVNNFEIRKIFWKQVSLLGTTMGSDKDFSNMIEFTEKNKITPIVDKIFDMENIHEAFMRMEKSIQMGKIVIKVS